MFCFIVYWRMIDMERSFPHQQIGVLQRNRKPISVLLAFLEFTVTVIFSGLKLVIFQKAFYKRRVVGMEIYPEKFYSGNFALKWILFIECHPKINLQNITGTFLSAASKTKRWFWLCQCVSDWLDLDPTITKAEVIVLFPKILYLSRPTCALLFVNLIEV